MFSNINPRPYKGWGGGVVDATAHKVLLEFFQDELLSRPAAVAVLIFLRTF